MEGSGKHTGSPGASLQALVPVTIEVEVPFDLHRYIIGQKGSGIRRMMDEFEVVWFVALPGSPCREQALSGRCQGPNTRSRLGDVLPPALCAGACLLRGSSVTLPVLLAPSLQSSLCLCR